MAISADRKARQKRTPLSAATVVRMNAVILVFAEMMAPSGSYFFYACVEEEMNAPFGELFLESETG